MNTEKSPLISCILIASDNLVAIKRSINCFKNQSYESKELIIVSLGDSFFNAAIQRFIQTINDVKIIFKMARVEVIKEIDIIIDRLISGSIIATWDISYQYHKNRIAVQLAHLLDKKADVSFLVEELQLFEQDQLLFPIDRAFNNDDLRTQLIPKTLMMKIEKVAYPTNEEDILSQLLQARISITGLSGQAFLAIKHVQSSTEEQKQQLLNFAIQKSSDVKKVKEQIPYLANVLKHYWVPTPLGIYSGNEQLGIYHL